MPVYRDIKNLTRDGYEHIFENDIHRYYLNGELHREDGPAVIYHFGLKKWYKNGKCHRLDGPAETMSDGVEFRERFFINDVEVDGEVYMKVLRCKLEDLPLYMNTEYAPLAKKRLEGALNKKVPEVY